MYYYKHAVTEQDYDRLHAKWSASRPECPVDESKDLGPEELARWVEWRNSPRYRRWERREPQIEWEVVEPSGRWCVDMVIGLIPVTLCLHQEFTSNFPYIPCQQVLAKWKLKHIHLGPYHHMMRVNIYEAGSLRFMKTLEVDLWQKVPAIADVVDPVMADLRTSKLRPKIFRY